MSAVVKLENIHKVYDSGEVKVHAVRGVSIDIQQGEFVALMGASGSGKSTLMNLLGCLDRPTGGRYFLDGQDVSRMSDDALSEISSTYLGFIFQAYNLLPQYTVVENIELPLIYQGVPPSDGTKARCMALAEMVGLGDRMDHR